MKNQIFHKNILKFNRNPFLTLGKYIARQEENLLTQSLCVLFNNSSNFRKSFFEILARKNESAQRILTEVDKAYSLTQVSHRFRANGRQRIISDMEIYRSGGELKFIVECKYDSALSLSQISAYRSQAKKEKFKNVDVVFLTRFGIDDSLAEIYPEAIWITWDEVASLVVKIKSSDKSEFFLIKGFLEMLSEYEIEPVSGLKRRDWQSLGKLHQFFSGQSGNLHFDRLDSLKIIMSRLIVFANTNWSSLAQSGFKIYSRLYTWENEDGRGKSSCVGVGFWNGYNSKFKKKGLKECYLGILFDLETRQISIYSGVEYLGKESKVITLKEWSNRKSEQLFTSEIQKALDEISPEMIKTLRKYTKGPHFFRF